MEIEYQNRKRKPVWLLLIVCVVIGAILSLVFWYSGIAYFYLYGLGFAALIALMLLNHRRLESSIEIYDEGVRLKGKFRTWKKIRSADIGNVYNGRFCEMFFRINNRQPEVKIYSPMDREIKEHFRQHGKKVVTSNVTMSEWYSHFEDDSIDPELKRDYLT